MTSKVAIVILNYQSYLLTIEYIKNLRLQKGISLHYIVVDNASPNHSIEFLEDEFSEDQDVTLIKSLRNGGYSYGNNLGITEALKCDYDYIFVSNNDVNWPSDFSFLDLTSSYKRLEDKFNDIAFFTGRMVDSKGTAFPGWKLPTLSFDIAMFIPGIRRVYRNAYQEIIDGDSKFAEVIPGSFFGARSNIFRQFTPLDEKVFLYCEERILASKVKDSGYKNLVISNVKYIHDSSSTIDSVLTKRAKMIEVFKSVNYYHKKRKNSIIGRVTLKLLQKLYLSRI